MSEPIKTYELKVDPYDCGMIPVPRNGEWMRTEDFEAALESARAEAKRLQSALDHMMDESRFPPGMSPCFMGKSKSELWDLIRVIECIYGPSLNLSAAATRLKAEHESGCAEAFRMGQEEMREQCADAFFHMPAVATAIRNLPLKDKP